MKGIDRNLLADWLRAETGRSEELAEAALTRLLARLPEDGPSAAFAERVLTRVRSERAPAGAAAWAWRLGLAACLLLVASSVVFVPVVLFSVLPGTVGFLVEGLARGLVGIVGWLDQGLSLWRGLGDIGSKVALVLATPQAAAALLGSAALGAAAFRMLYGLTMQDRRAFHGDSLHSR